MFEPLKIYIICHPTGGCRLPLVSSLLCVVADVMPLESMPLLELSHARGRALTHTDECELDTTMEFACLGLACFNIVFALIVLGSYRACGVYKNAAGKTKKTCFLLSVGFAALLWIILFGVAIPSAISESYTSCWLFFFVLIACIAFILLLCTVGGVYCCCRRKTPITPK